MSRQTLRDRNQHVIGYIDVEFSGRQCLRDSNNTVTTMFSAIMSPVAIRPLTPTTMLLATVISLPRYYDIRIDSLTENYVFIKAKHPIEIIRCFVCLFLDRQIY